MGCLLWRTGCVRGDGAAGYVFGDDGPAVVGDGLGHDEHGLEVHDAGDAGDVDADELTEVVEVAQRELHDHVELAGDVVAGAHAGHLP